MRSHGVAGVHKAGEHWEVSFAGPQGYRFSPGIKYQNCEKDITQLIANIHQQLDQMEVRTSRVILVDVLPKVDPIFYRLADNFKFPLVVAPLRLKLHEKRLGRAFPNMGELAVEAAITGWATEILLIETTNACTFRCLYCPQDIMKRKKNRLPLATITKIIEEYASNAIGTLGFHVMGEPTLNPDLPQLIEYASKLHVGHALVTNASILTRQSAEDLFRKGLQHIMLSVQTFTKEQHNAVKRPTSPQYSYETIMRNVKDIILAKWSSAPDARLEIHVMDNSIYRPRGVNIVSDNSDARQVLNFWKNFIREASVAFGGSRISPVYLEQEEFDISKMSWPLGEYPLAPDVFLSFKKAGHWIQDFTSAGEYIIPANKGVCRAITRKFTQHRQLAILSNGDAVMCCFDYNGETVFGNVFNASLGEIDDKAEKYREKLVGGAEIPFPVCRKCLGFRIRGFDDNFTARKQNEMIEVGKVAVYDTGANSLTLRKRLVAAGIEVLAFVEIPNAIVSLAARNESLDEVKVCSFDRFPEGVEGVLFPPEWNYDDAVVRKIKNHYLNLLIGQVDLVALDPFRSLPGKIEQESSGDEELKKSSTLFSRMVRALRQGLRQ